MAATKDDGAVVHIAIITTTIRIPELLSEFEYGPYSIYVAGDLNSPHDEIESFINGLQVDGERRYIRPEEQSIWAVSDIIGWQKIQRRNIATLEAITSGADVLYFWDDDNKPRYAMNHKDTVSAMNKAVAKSAIWNHRWFNPGLYAHQDYYARGYPVFVAGSSTGDT